MQELSCENITKDYGDGPVLNQVSLTVPAGESVAIMGPSGSGKSTLLHCLSGVLQPDEGQVRLGNSVINTLGDKRRSSLRLNKFGFVFQDGQLLPELTARENVALPLMLTGTPRSKALDAAEGILRRLGIGELVRRRPGQISGGQAQRVAIARALVGEPEVVFADEPTGALDQPTGHEVMQMLTAVTTKVGSTLVIVTHDPKVADWCSRIIEIRDGIVHSEMAAGGVR